MRRRPIEFLSLLLMCGLGCGDGSSVIDDSAGDTLDTSGSEDTSIEVTEPRYDFEAESPWYTCPIFPFPEDFETVRVFDGVDQYYGSENLRTVSAEVSFPESGDWQQIGLWVQLDCPVGGYCDVWDRAANIDMLLNPEDDESEWEYIELARHMTPYGMGMCQFIDVTPLASLFSGSRTLRSFIDTWVAAGSSSGDGWRTTVDVVFMPGTPAEVPEVENIWGMRSITSGQTQAGSTVPDQIEPVTVSIPEGTSRVEAHLTVTGHSFGNTKNCAEFCQMRHDVMVDGETYSVNPWRPDCSQNPVSPQGGTWQYARNGWCPGAISVGHIIDITDSVVPGSESTIDFDILLANGEVYQNYSPVDLLPYTRTALKLYFYP